MFLLFIKEKERLNYEMKKTFIFSGMVAVSLLATTAGAMKVHAADAKVQDTTGTVTFEAGTGGGSSIGGLNLDGDSKLIPADLNFGSTKIKYDSDTTLKATSDGNQSSAATTGKLKITDERGTASGWKVKVEQTKQFQSNGKELTGAVLSMTTGNVTNIGGTTPTGGMLNQKVELTPNTAVDIFKANANEGDGISELSINEFGLKIPGAAPKSAGAYSTAITWTLSDTI